MVNSGMTPSLLHCAPGLVVPTLTEKAESEGGESGRKIKSRFGHVLFVMPVRIPRGHVR